MKEVSGAGSVLVTKGSGSPTLAGQIIEMAEINDRPRTRHGGGKYRLIPQFP